MQDKQKKKNQRKMMKGKDRNERQAIQRVEAAPHLQLCSSLLAVMPAGGWWLVAGGWARGTRVCAHKPGR